MVFLVRKPKVTNSFRDEKKLATFASFARS